MCFLAPRMYFVGALPGAHGVLPGFHGVLPSISIDYSRLLGCAFYRAAQRRKRSKKTDVDEVDDLEDNYEKLLGKKNSLSAASKFDTKSLLPTKCKELGVVRRSIQVPKKTGLLVICCTVHMVVPSLSLFSSRLSLILLDDCSVLVWR